MTISSELDFQDRIIEAIEANCNLFATISVPVIPASVNGIGFMLTPSGPGTCDYAGQWDKTYGFQVAVRHTDQLTAIRALNAVSQYIDNLKKDEIKSQNGSFSFVSSAVTSLPNFLGKDDHGFVYVASYQAELLLN